MTVFIFTESLTSTGLGHLRRCTALAEKLQEEGSNVAIVLHTDETVLEDDNKIPIISLNWKDCELIQSFLNQKQIEIAYVDSYLANFNIYQIIYQSVEKLICIDDYNRIQYPKSAVILNPGFGGKYLTYNHDPKLILTGIEYVLLRKPFRENFMVPKKKKAIQSILVTVGGDDRWNLVPRILNFLVMHYPQWKKEIVVGPAFINIVEIENAKDSNTFLHERLSAIQMRDLMLSVDFAITAGGQTTYELNRCGIPMIIIETAANQRGNIRGLMEEKGILYSGKASEPNILNNIQKCLTVSNSLFFDN